MSDQALDVLYEYKDEAMAKLIKKLGGHEMDFTSKADLKSIEHLVGQGLIYICYKQQERIEALEAKRSNPLPPASSGTPMPKIKAFKGNRCSHSTGVTLVCDDCFEISKPVPFNPVKNIAVLLPGVVHSVDVSMSFGETTTTVGRECKHQNGWRERINIFWGITRWLFICTDCSRVLNKDKK
jgi:hypothetical protein